MTAPTPIDRLRAFRASWNQSDVIDEDSGLTADDLDAIIRAADSVVAIESIDLSDPAQVARWQRER